MDGWILAARKKKSLPHVPKRGVKKALMRWYARYPIIMDTVVGVRELERHECGALWSADIFPIEIVIATESMAWWPQKRRVRALLAQEPGRCCLQESGNPRNAFYGQGFWGDSGCSKRWHGLKNQSVSWIQPNDAVLHTPTLENDAVLHTSTLKILSCSHKNINFT